MLQNRGYSYREQIGPESRGLTVLDYLAQQYRHSSPQVWRSRLEAGEVELDGEVAAADAVLSSGQILVWHRPPWLEPEVPLHYSVIHEDEQLLVVDKPSGLPTAPAGGFFAHTLLALVQQRDPAWTPMHRLGRGTSGLVVFARGESARGALQSAFRGREVEKRYLALAQGRLEPRRIDAPIGPVKHPRLGELHAASPEGKPSQTIVERCEARGPATLATVRILTGRPHQIRIHLAYAGHPLVGDPLYGPGGQPQGELPALPGDIGYHLHAWKLSFAHPASGRAMGFEAERPAALT